MSEYVIVTDSALDMNIDQVNALGITLSRETKKWDEA